MQINQKNNYNLIVATDKYRFPSFRLILLSIDGGRKRKRTKRDETERETERNETKQKEKQNETRRNRKRNRTKRDETTRLENLICSPRILSSLWAQNAQSSCWRWTLLGEGEGRLNPEQILQKDIKSDSWVSPAKKTYVLSTKFKNWLDLFLHLWN